MDVPHTSSLQSAEEESSPSLSSTSSSTNAEQSPTESQKNICSKSLSLQKDFCSKSLSHQDSQVDKNKDNFNFKEFWKKILITNYTIQYCDIIQEYDATQKSYKKKLIKKNEHDSFSNLGIELNLAKNSQGIFIDVDHVDKLPLFDTDNLHVFSFLKNKNLYFETSMNKGLHIFIMSQLSVHNLFNFRSSVSNIIFEFKKNCIVYPTQGYKVYSSPLIPQTFINKIFTKNEFGVLFLNLLCKIFQYKGKDQCFRQEFLNLSIDTITKSKSENGVFYELYNIFISNNTKSCCTSKLKDVLLGCVLYDFLTYMTRNNFTSLEILNSFNEFLFFTIESGKNAVFNSVLWHVQKIFLANFNLEDVYNDKIKSSTFGVAINKKLAISNNMQWFSEEEDDDADTDSKSGCGGSNNNNNNNNGNDDDDYDIIDSDSVTSRKTSNDFIDVGNCAQNKRWHEKSGEYDIFFNKDNDNEDDNENDDNDDFGKKIPKKQKTRDKKIEFENFMLKNTIKDFKTPYINNV